MVEKLAKALEGLKNIQFTTSNEDTNISKKEKMFFCVLAADVMVSIKSVNAQSLAAAMENMINLCDDKDSDVRMVAEESLNRIIVSLSEGNMLKIQLELHKIIKKNGPARCVRAALTRFGQLSHCIRPHKGRGHAQVLIPSLIEIAKREEESVHETLASSFDHIFRVLGIFVPDNNLKSLIKAFLHNLSSSNPVIRRCSASCIITIVQYCRKPHIFNSYVLNSLLDCVVPICEENSTDLILGILGCLRLLLPTLTCVRNEEGISGSFGLRKKQEECLLSVDRLIQTYELCLHYTKSKDHNVVAAALESLNQVLQNPPQQLETFFLAPAGFSRSYVHSVKENKLWSRSGSEMSIACSLPAIDESLLFDENDISSQFSTLSAEKQFEPKQTSSRSKDSFLLAEDDVKIIESPFKDRLLVAGKSVGSQGTLDVDSDTESTATSELNTPSNFLLRVETEDVEDFEECFRSNSQDDLYSPGEGERFCPLTSVIDVGNFTDAAVPLIYCARHLTASFLLEGTAKGLKSDRSVRVSIKSLALSCMSAIVKIYPVIMKMSLGKNHNDFYNQEISDILLYSDHPDPQIRGCVSNLVGCFVNSALSESKGFTSDWLSDIKSKLNCDYLIDIILEGLKDKYSVCSRQALSAIKLCVSKGLHSVYNNQFLSLVECLPGLTNNSYWLVKVKLTEVLADLPYVCLNDLSESNLYQENVIDSVLLPLLGDEDARVRLAAAEALVKIIRVLYYGKSTVTDCTKPCTSHLNNWLEAKHKLGSNLSVCPPFSYLLMEPEEFRFDDNIEIGLSRIVAKLSFSLLIPENKHFLFGYIEALKLMSQAYPPTVYSKGWNCWKEKTDKSEINDSFTSSLISVVLSLLMTSPLILDLTAFSSATLLLGNLFAGLCIFHLKKCFQVSGDPSTGESIKLWDVFTSERLSQIAEEIFIHLLKVLNIYSGLVEEVTLSSVSESSSASAFLPLLSPIKKPDKKGGREERTDDKKSKNPNRYKQTTQYARLQDLLKNAHTNYKVSLDASVRDKFLNLLESNLYTLSVLLEIATVRETGRCAEEILSYLRAAFSLRASPTVTCVIQLLKSFFGTNLASNWEDVRLASTPFHGLNLFDSVFHLPTQCLSDKIRRRVNLNSLECENLTGFSRRTERKVLIKNTDKTSLSSYIRLLEPMVVKSLQLYTITGDVKLQLNVLQLLNQLVQLRVNYCLIDEKQVFVGFVLSQFELIEHGQLPGVEELLPHVFKFLVLLSYQKQHSKPILSIPKIMQLCDGLMASDQSIETHCIPALSPVVEDIFLSRSVVTSAEEKELETQREVLISMLLRLVEFPRVMDLLALILNESKTSEEKERWKRWSRQVVDAVLPLANQDRLRIETLEGQNSLVKLMSSLSVNALRPIDPLLKALFVEPNDYKGITSLNRWLSRVTVMLETVLFVKEHALLSKLEEICPNLNLAGLVPSGNLFSPDPFNVKSFFQVYDAPETAARFIVKVISVVANKILECDSSSFHLQQKLSMFFVCVFHLLKSGAFHRITNALQSLVSKESESLTVICSLFHKMTHVCPMLTSQFSYFLSLSNYCDLSFWAKILAQPSTLPAKLVQSCGIIALSDYLCDNLSDTDTLRYLLANNAKELVIFSHEIPTKELLVTVHKRKSDWTLLADTISSASFHLSRPRHVEKLLRFLEISDNCHSGALLDLLVNKFLGSPRLALSLLAGSVACRQVEFLLTLPKEKILDLVDARRFAGLVEFFKDDRHSRRHLTLWGLLTKLGGKAFDFSLTELKQPQAIDSKQSKDIQLNEDWFFKQVKQRCCQKNCSSVEISCLLRKLSCEKIIEIMSTPNFNISVLGNCLKYFKTPRKDLDWSEVGFEARRFFDASDPLQKASKSCLLRLIGEARESLLRAQRDADTETITDRVVEEILRDENFYPKLVEIADCLTFFLETLYAGNSDVETDDLDGIFHFGILYLEVIRWELEKQKMEGKRRVHSRNLESCLKCFSAVVKSRKVGSLLSEVETGKTLSRIVKNIFCILTHIIPRCCLSKVQGPKKLMECDESEQLAFLLGFILDKGNDSSLPEYLMSCFRDLVINVCRTPEVSRRVLKVPETSDTQDIEVLENFILKFSVVGWSSKQQFEEIWVALLSVLGFNEPKNMPWEENKFLAQASATAIEGITALLKDTMMDSGRKKLIRHGRDSLSMKNVFPQLPLVRDAYGSDDVDDRLHHFLDNLEISRGDDRYVAGQLSVEYLWTAVKQISSRVEVHEKHSQDLSAIGLDLPSCIHFLTELYSQWLHQRCPDIRIITASLKSSLVISDMFTDISQFQWLLNFCFRVYEIIIAEDTVILPLIILGVCKAGAIVLPNNEVCEKIKKIMLRCKNLPCRLAAIRGLLYLLQSYIVSYAVNHTALPPAGSTFQTEEANFVANIVDTFLPVALDFAQQFKLDPEPGLREYVGCHWSLIFYLLQHYHSSLGNLKDEYLNFILSTLHARNCSNATTALLIRGVERLLLTTVIDENLRDQLSKVSLDVISSNSVTVAGHGLQLLTVLSFLEKRVKDIRQSVISQDDHEKIMKDMEKINVLFEKLKKSYPREAEVIGRVISYILMDFTASDVLTKVIQEFLSSHQPHQKILAGLLFKVFERAELSLLEDWVVFSLPSFIQGLPIAMSVWTLSCFFVSASSEPWLRSMFPLVQSRMRMAQLDDKKFLCLSAAHFYKQLKQESQRKSFVQTFENAIKIDRFFLDLLSSFQ